MQNDLNRVRQAVVSHIGSKVKIRANKGRHKIDITEGVISETYPSIFLVRVDNEVEETSRMVSFSYTDVLTKDVRMTLCS
ncbi:MAG: Veg family protein [bacterium]|nr:Veg family protein [bacterium]